MTKTQARLNPIRRSCGEHCHPFPQLLFGLCGTVDCEFLHSGCDVSAARVAIVPGGEVHFFAGKDADSEMLVVDLDVAHLEQEYAESGVPFQLTNNLFEVPRFIQMSDDLLQLTTFAARQLKQLTVYSNVISYQWATMLTAQMCLLLSEGTREQHDKRIGFDRLVDSQLASPPSNRELQSALGMSSTSLNGWAHERFGMTPQQRVLLRRLQWARHWLETTDKPIGNIAHELGFYDNSAMTRACRRILGMTPREIRHRETEPKP